MVERFDKNYELMLDKKMTEEYLHSFNQNKEYKMAIDKELVEKQHKFITDSLKGSGVEVTLKEETNDTAADDITRLFNMIKVDTDKITADSIRIAEAFKTISKRLKEIKEA